MMIATSEPEIDHYLALPYRIELIPDPDGWFVRIPELPGCMSQGDTPEEALEMIRDAQRSWLQVALEDGRPIPTPHGEGAYSGKFNVRIPKDLHRELVDAAKMQGVSLNLYVATALARTMGASLAAIEKAPV